MPRFREYRWAAWTEWAVSQICADRPEVIAVDTETTGLGFHDEPFCATLTWRTPAGELKSAYVALEGDDRYTGILAVREILASVPTWVFHNAKFDLQKLELVEALPLGWRTEKVIEDTQVIAALTDENARKALKFLAATVLKIEDVITVTVKSGPNKGTTKRVPRQEHELNAVRRKMGLTKDDPWDLLPRGVIVPYAIKDTEYTLLLFEKMKPALPPAVLPAYRREIDVTLVLLDMEANGIALDMDYLARTTSDYGVRVMEGADRLAALTKDPEFNPGSWQQIQAQLAARGVKVDSTAESVLKQLDDELARAILAYRGDQKMHMTYLRPLLTEQKDAVIHPWFNVVQARTGRMSSSSAHA